MNQGNSMSESMSNEALVQFGSSDGADFEAGTWTFSMPGGYRVGAGVYAILPKKEYDAIRSALSQQGEAECACNSVIERGNCSRPCGLSPAPKPQGEPVAQRLFGELVEVWPDDRCCLVGTDTGRVIANFSHGSEAECVMEHFNAAPPAPAADELAGLRQELHEITDAIPGPVYMDPPDGGCTTIAEQVRRMAADVEATREKLAASQARVVELEAMQHRKVEHVRGRQKGDGHTYRPAAGEMCLISGPNCDNEDGYVFFEYRVLWRDETFVLYGKEGCWPNLNKWDHVIAKPLPNDAALTPPSNAAPASAELVDGMTAERAAYFMRRFKSEEKLLGPNEQAAIDYVLAMLAAPASDVAPERVTRNDVDIASLLKQQQWWSLVHDEGLKAWGRHYRDGEHIADFFVRMIQMHATPAAESVPERAAFITIYNLGYKAGHHDTVESQYTDIHQCDMATYHADVVADLLADGSIPAAESVAQEGDGLWLIHFEDKDQRPEVFTNEQVARNRHAVLLFNWACHLFRQVPSAPVIPQQTAAGTERDVVQRAIGRAEALSLILKKHPETFGDEMWRSLAPCGPDGEWDTGWNEEKLRAFLRVEDSAWSLLEKTEDETCAALAALADRDARIAELRERDIRVLHNTRRLIRHKTMTNAHLYSEVFGTGMTTAFNRCRELGFDPDTAAPTAGEG